MSKSHMNIVLGSLLYMALPKQGVGPDDLQKSLPNSTILWLSGKQTRPLVQMQKMNKLVRLYNYFHTSQGTYNIEMCIVNSFTDN